MNDSKLKFLTDKMQAGVTRTNAKGVEEKSTEVQGSLSQTWMADYPLIAYNSYLSDNSQILGKMRQAQTLAQPYMS